MPLSNTSLTFLLGGGSSIKAGTGTRGCICDAPLSDESDPAFFALGVQANVSNDAAISQINAAPERCTEHLP
jgi:hypothetical protein